MSPRGYPRETRNPAHEAAVIAQVLDALVAAAETAGLQDQEGDQSPAATPGVEELLAATRTELSREPAQRPWTASAPVLGSGVVQSILAGRKAPAAPDEPPPEGGHVDERL
jgi:hypothetical protein